MGRAPTALKADYDGQDAADSGVQAAQKVKTIVLGAVLADEAGLRVDFSVRRSCGLSYSWEAS